MIAITVVLAAVVFVLVGHLSQTKDKTAAQMSGHVRNSPTGFAIGNLELLAPRNGAGQSVKDLQVQQRLGAGLE